MRKAFLASMTFSGSLVGSLSAQNLERRADLTSNGDTGRGKCTVEVVVDGSAEIQIRGATATMYNVQGQQPQWRRFQCTSPLPSNPASFRFEGVDGRGRQELIQYPRNGGGAVVRITDSAGGAEGYTFDLIWDNFSSDGPSTVTMRDTVAQVRRIVIGASIVVQTLTLP